MKRKLIILCISVLIGIAGTYFYTKESEAEEIQQEIAANVLRFHVLANSDSEEDQQLKLQVKDAVVDYMNPYLNKQGLSLAETKAIVEEQKDEIIAVAEQVIAENGADYAVTAELTRDYFPVKSYGDVTLPAGEYDAFRIQIGDADGKNWWCVLYPPLCFVDVTYGYVPDSSKEQLQNVLDEECYEAVINGGVPKENIEIRSKVWEFLSEII